MSLVDHALRPYRDGVGAVILNRHGQVFIGRRTDMAEIAWQLPQGGIDAGETPRQAVFREVAEETGMEHLAMLAELDRWLTYDLPAAIGDVAWGGRYRGQRQKWFALQFLGDDGKIDLDASGHREFAAWRWVPMGDLPGLVCEFKRDVYREIVAAFGHLALAGPQGCSTAIAR